METRLNFCIFKVTIYYCLIQASSQLYYQQILLFSSTKDYWGSVSNNWRDEGERKIDFGGGGKGCSWFKTADHFILKSSESPSL